MNNNEELATIKKSNEVESISREEFEYRIKAIKRAKRDINWWAEQFFKIISLDKGLITIKLYEKQKELLEFLVNNDRTIVLSSRQLRQNNNVYNFLFMVSNINC